MSKSPGTPSYEDLAALVVELVALVDSLQVEVAALRRQVGRDSSTSSQPPSQDGPAAKAKAKADKRAAERTDALDAQVAPDAPGGQEPDGEREPAAERGGPSVPRVGRRATGVAVWGGLPSRTGPSRWSRPRAVVVVAT